MSSKAGCAKSIALNTFVRLAAAVLLTAGIAAGDAASAQPQKRGERPELSLRKRFEAYRASPFRLFVAKGGPNACGEGCDTWIAAEGTLGPTAAQQIRRFLARPGRAGLPIFFNSEGGSVTQAMEIGRLLRQRKITAGVGETTPQGCSPGSREKACLTLKRSDKPVAADLHLTHAYCASACVYALIGAAVRQVPPDAKLGVHASIVYRIYSDGSVTLAPAQHLKELNERTKRYVAEMGVDVALMDAAIGTRHDTIRYLTRDEIARFGIDTRRFHETPWVLESATERATVMKLFVEAKGADQKQFRPSVVRIGCERDGGRIGVLYIRGLEGGEAKPAANIALALGNVSIDFSQTARVAKIDALEAGTLFESRLTYAPADAFTAAVDAGRFEITESDPSDAKRSRVTHLSTAGLRTAIDGLRTHCSKRAGTS